MPNLAARERDRKFVSRYRQQPLTVVVAGASGLVGKRLLELLQAGGHSVRQLVRRAPAAEGEFFWDPARGQLDPAVFEGADAVVHLGGATIAQRFSSKNKAQILRSRVESTELLARTLAGLVGQDGGVQLAAKRHLPHTFVCASAVGFYGLGRGQELLAEGAPAGSGFLAEVCQQWEAAAAPAEQAGLRVVKVRTGLVQSAAGGMLKLQLPLFRVGLGGWVGDGNQAQSWVSLDDIAGVYFHALFAKSLSGPVNAVAPSPVTAKQLAKAVGVALRRPVLFPIPAFAPALLLKREGARELALASQRASAQKLLESGYVFFDPELGAALARELGRDARA
ncbi:MAG: TIGR01777 family oxidoreductase [Rothia sp. (in: high G+C Gram-positive bacteria)]|nr:TIGR01777 family oxidoreductase [Rothia sp. (in: high G+C Gram-positive bacteria)]